MTNRSPARRPCPPRLLPLALLPLALAPAACAGTGGSGPGEAPEDDAEPAPWSAPALRPTAVPRPFLTEWTRAENRKRCALLVPADVAPEGAEARAARFGGGWGVAWDLPDQRSVFGVAGTGVTGGEGTYDEWPHQTTWADGSVAGYGPEGGSGPNTLAYLTIPGEACLYNVWSRLGREHLETLLRSLRFVDTAALGGAAPDGHPGQAMVQRAVVFSSRSGAVRSPGSDTR